MTKGVVITLSLAPEEDGTSPTKGETLFSSSEAEAARLRVKVTREEGAPPFDESVNNSHKSGG